MTAATPAYLRRSLDLLEWIDAHRPDAGVRCDAAEWGVWKDLRPRWILDGNRIRMQMQRPGKPALFWIHSVNPAPWGARSVIWGRCRPARELRIIWSQPETRPISGLLNPIVMWLRTKWPGCRILSVGQGIDRTHTLSGGYFRIRLQYGGAEVLVLARAGEEIEGPSHAILTQALLWLAHLTAQRKLAGIPAVHLLVPEGHGPMLLHGARMINRQRARIRVWEFSGNQSQILVAKQPDDPPAPVEDRDFRWPVLGPFRWSPLLARVLDLAPEAIQRYPRFHDYDSLRLWGLEFARVLGPERDRILFGVAQQQTELTGDNFEELRALVDQILYYRRADSPVVDHPYYRLQAERWLESLMLKDIEFLFPELARGSVYPQIPVYLGKVPGRVDVLGADREGNLVVMELKVNEDPGMPVQSLDYWGRVIAHNLKGDFERRGYFAGIRLSRARPKLYLVAPVFTFHDSFEHVLGCLDPGLEVTKIAINEDWRCGVKILKRRSFCCGEIG